MEFIDNIKKLCKENGISLHALEQKLGYGQGSIARSQTIKADRLKEIADYFGVTMDEVYSGKDSIDYKIGDPEQDYLIEYCLPCFAQKCGKKCGKIFEAKVRKIGLTIHRKLVQKIKYKKTERTPTFRQEPFL